MHKSQNVNTSYIHVYCTRSSVLRRSAIHTYAEDIFLLGTYK